jgi:hypothetical protein
VILAGNPQAQIIAHLTDPVQGPSARMLQDLITARTGILIPVVEPAAAMGHRQWPGGGTHIVIGVLGTNQTAQELYYEYRTVADHAFPGPDGYALQTLADPYGRSSDFVVVAGTTARPLARAIARLADLLAWDNDLIYLSHMNLVEVPDPGLKQAGTLWPRAEAGVPRDAGTYFLWLRDEAERVVKGEGSGTVSGAGGLLLAHACCAGTYYMMSGKTGFLDAFHAALKAHGRLRGAGEATHRHLYQAMAVWSMVEGAGYWTQGKKEFITGHLLGLLRSEEGPGSAEFANAVQAPGVLGERKAYDALSAFFGGRYFSVRHNLPEARVWLSLAHRAFNAQEQSSKALCDSAAHEGRVMWAMATYALATGERAFFLNNACRDYCRAVMMGRANRGDLPGHGASEGGTKLPVGLLAIAAHVYQRPAYLGAVHGHGMARALGRSYATQMKPADPGEHYVGIRKSAVDRQFFYQAVSPGEPGLGQVEPDSQNVGLAWRPSFQKAFDKLAFRAGAGIDDEFLLLDGIGAGENAHEDANTVLELSVFGRQFIVEEGPPDGTMAGAEDHNGVTIARDGAAQTPAAGAEIETMGDLPGVGFGVTRVGGGGVNGEAGSEWSRLVLWRKGHCFLFFDEITAKEAGRYRYQSVWRGLGEARAQEDGTLRLVQGPQVLSGNGVTGGRAGRKTGPGVTEFFIVPGDQGRVHIKTEPGETGRAFTGYPHAAPMVTRMTRTIKGKRQAGQHDEFVTGLFWRRGAGEPAPKVRRVAKTAAFVMDKGFRALGWMLPEGREGQRLLGLQITARAGWIEDDRLSLFGARLFWCRFLSFSASNPVNIEWSRAEGLTVETEAQTELRFRMGPDRYTLAVDAGRHNLGRVVIELPDLYPVMDLVERAAEGMGQGVRRANTPEARARGVVRGAAHGVYNARSVVRTVAPVSALGVTHIGGRTLIAAGDAAGAVFVCDMEGREVMRYKLGEPVSGLAWREVSRDAEESAQALVLEIVGRGGGRVWVDLAGKSVTVGPLEAVEPAKGGSDRAPEGALTWPGLEGQRVLEWLPVASGAVTSGVGVVWVVTTQTDQAIGLDYMGRRVWRAGVGARPVKVVGPDATGGVYVGTEAGRVVVLDGQTGKLRLKARLPGLMEGPGALVCATGDGSVFAMAGDGVFKIEKARL